MELVDKLRCAIANEPHNKPSSPLFFHFFKDKKKANAGFFTNYPYGVGFCGLRERMKILLSATLNNREAT